MPPSRLRQRKFWKFDYEMLHSEVYLNKYMWSAYIAPFSPPPFRKLLFFACFRFLIFHPFFQGGGSADPICPYVRTPMDRPLPVAERFAAAWCREWLRIPVRPLPIPRAAYIAYVSNCDCNRHWSIALRARAPLVSLVRESFNRDDTTRPDATARQW